MIRILFVCLGNICRSPMAEAVMRHLIEREGLGDRVSVDSAGTGSWHIGEPPHAGTRRALARRGISWEGIRARRISADDLDAFDYIICMDTDNRRDVERIGRGRARVMTFMELVRDARSPDVPDPYYSGNFEEVYELVEKGCEELLRRIREELQEAPAAP
ncbi:MAG: phosphotyrosine protein phosphatase [Thermobacillus sp. ZCTH02-B1]|uniref:low molecular weight protein-tyrosine-phosphatase n=1 Tax=Thermobacillus sp. ZCTH02-B1 TaxID=1858795 RepID=UPI000B5728CB|nr:low molecular weight protein-tyrosine-phosphatase [Thermobacillus sp. ZCTH02-B1]OUM96672.1 MAG: phosphotyrosine protein phosphatase [Thermobacillus sp. ZCTH02-B1]